MKKSLLALCAVLALNTGARGQGLIISQYYEGTAGTNRALELWNTTGSSIDFSVTNLVIENWFNGGAVANTLTIATGVVAAGDVFVITNTDAAGDAGLAAAGVTPDVDASGEAAMNYNGDDALAILLGGTTSGGGTLQDSFGQRGVDPGSAWSNNGVSSANQNIQLKPAIFAGDLVPDDAWDTSARFEFVSAADQTGAGFAGFGFAPVPEPTTSILLGVGLLTAGLGLRRKQS